MNGRSIRTIAANDLRRRRRDPLGLLVTLAIPVTLLVVFRLAFGGIDSGQTPRAKLLVVDADDSFLSRFVAGSFGQGQLATMVQAVPADSARALRDLKRNKASAALFIPKGFGRDYLEGRPTKLRLLKNPSERILPTIVEEIVATLADGGAAVRDLLSGPIQGIRDGTSDWKTEPPEEVIAGISVDIQRMMNKSAGYFLPPAIGVKTAETDGKEKGPGFLLLFFPGLVGMALLYLSQVVALDFTVERRMGTIRRALSTGAAPGELFTGKIAAGMLVMAALLLVVFALGGWLLKLPVARLLSGWLLAVAASFGVLGTICLLALFPRSPNQANVITNIVILPISFLGGCYFPIEALDEKLHAIAARSPMGWIVERLKDVTLGRAHDPAQPWIAAGLCIGFGLLLLGLSGRVAARRFHEA